MNKEVVVGFLEPRIDQMRQPVGLLTVVSSLPTNINDTQQTNHSDYFHS
jgi:hypothetical protein